MSLLVQCKHFCHSTQDTLLTTRILKQSNKAKAFFIYVHMINSKGQFIIISGRVMSLKLARVSSTKSEKQYSFYIHWFWQSLLLQKACQILIPTWLKIRDKQWISIQIISSSVQTFSLVFRKIYINICLYFICNFQFKDYEVSKFSDMGKITSFTSFYTSLNTVLLLAILKGLPDFG